MLWVMTELSLPSSDAVIVISLSPISVRFISNLNVPALVSICEFTGWGDTVSVAPGSNVPLIVTLLLLVVSMVFISSSSGMSNTGRYMVTCARVSLCEGVSTVILTTLSPIGSMV